MFEEKWNKESSDIKARLYEGRYSEEIIKNKMYKIRIDAVLSFIDEFDTTTTKYNLDLITPRIKELIKEYFLAHNIVYRNYLLEQAKGKELKAEIESTIQNEYDIRSKVSEWKNNKINSIQAAKLKELKNETEQLIAAEMDDKGIHQPKILFIKNCNYQEIHQEILNKSLEQSKLKVPAKVFKINFIYYKPKGTYLDFPDPPSGDNNNVSNLQENANPAQRIYKLKTSYVFTISSSYCFWRFPLMFIRYFAYANNIAIYSFRNIFNSSFGLNSFTSNEVVSNYSCNPETGEVTKGEVKSTLKSSLSKLCSSIATNRNEFEISPDDSFFGKNCARIFNIIYNYVIKTFTAFFVFMIGYSTVIIFWSLFWFVVLITCYIWALIAVFFHAMFNLFIIDTDYPRNDSIGYGLFPIIFYVIFVKCFLQFFATIMLLIIQPILAILICFLGLLRLILRFFYDIFMFVIIWMFAKLPLSDSFLAWKTSGPGLSRKYYNHIEVGDALTIVHAELEKCELNSFRSNVISLLEEPIVRVNNVYKKFYFFDLKFDPNPVLLESFNYYKQLLNHYILNRLSYFPNVGKVKFTEEELTTLKISSREYIREYVTSHKMDFIFDTFELQKNSWGKLTEKILKSAFGSEILQSLEENDYRIEIKREENFEFDQLKGMIVEKSGFKNNNVDKNNLKEKIASMELSNIKIHEITDKSSHRLLYLNVHYLSSQYLSAFNNNINNNNDNDNHYENNNNNINNNYNIEVAES